MNAGVMTAAGHAHDAFRCPAHVRGCDCPDLGNFLCNPYCELGYCPDAIHMMPGDEEAYAPAGAIECLDGKTYGPGLAEVKPS
jgi:hypothetical protein